MRCRCKGIERVQERNGHGERKGGCREEKEKKKKKQGKMLKIVNFLYRNSDKNLNEALDYFSPSKKSQATIMEAFQEIQLSPIAIQSPDIPYMQTVESLLEFQNPSTNEIRYFDIIRIRSRGKKVFFTAKNN